MKTVYFLDQKPELDFDVLAINSHSKAYVLCWHINNEINTCFKKRKGIVFSKKRFTLSFTVGTKVLVFQLFKTNQNEDF